MIATRPMSAGVASIVALIGLGLMYWALVGLGALTQMGNKS